MKTLAASATEAHMAQERDHAKPRLAALLWGHFLNDGVTNYLPGVLPAILHNLHANVSLAGSIMAALLMGQAVQPASGWLADRVGGRLLIFGGLCITAAGGALIAFVPSYWSLIAVLTIIGLASSLFHPQALATVRQLGFGRQGLAMSVFLVGGELGRGVWPLLAGVVVVSFGIRSLWLLAVPAALSLPVLVHWVPRQIPGRSKDSAVRSTAQLGRLVPVIAFSAIRATLLFSLVTFVPLIWEERGGSLVSGASLISVLLVAGIVGNLGGGHLADRFGRRPVAIGAGILSALLLALVLRAGGDWLWIALGALGMAASATLPLTVLMGQDALPENRSLGSGLALGFSNGLGALAVMVLGLVGAHRSTETVLWINVWLTLAAVALAPLLPERGNGPPDRN